MGNRSRAWCLTGVFHITVNMEVITKRLLVAGGNQPGNSEYPRFHTASLRAKGSNF